MLCKLDAKFYVQLFIQIFLRDKPIIVYRVVFCIKYINFDYIIEHLWQYIQIEIGIKQTYNIDCKLQCQKGQFSENDFTEN